MSISKAILPVSYQPKERFSYEHWIAVVKDYIKAGFDVYKKDSSILGGYKHEYIINDFTYVFRTTDYYGQDYVIFKGETHRLWAGDTIKLMDYFDSFRYVKVNKIEKRGNTQP